MDFADVFSWLVYGFVILFLVALWFIAILYVFKGASETALTVYIGFLWVIPVSVFLGAMAFYAAKYLILLGLIK